MFELGTYLPYLLNRAGARLALQFSRELEAHGIVLQEWRVLAVLVAHGSQRLSDLAALTSIDISTLSRMIGRMTRKGLAVRSRANNDRREVHVALSPKGVRVTQAIIPTAQHYEHVALSGMSATDSKLLKRLLIRVYDNLDGLAAAG